MSEQALLQLPLAHRHISNYAKMIPFAGFEMPIQYVGIKEEHLAVRQRAGLFDVSHMGEIEVRGADAIGVVDRLVTNDVTRLVDGQALYTLLCHEHGGIVDDLLVYRLAADHVLLCVNASNREKDFNHIVAHAKGDAQITNVSDDFVQLALQGPLAQKFLGAIVEDAKELESIKYFFARYMKVAGHEVLVSRTGYTGEDGFELYMPNAAGEDVFDALTEAGQPHGLMLCGLGCRDTLRLEAKLPLYGQDLTDETNPLEAGLAWAVKLDTEEDFVGKAALIKIKQQGLTRRLRGLIVQGKGIIRPGCPISVGDDLVGVVTSGSYSISLDKSIGLGYVDLAHVDAPSALVQVRKNHLSVALTTKPFYKR